MGPEAEAVVVGIDLVAERKHPPYQGIIDSGQSASAAWECTADTAIIRTYTQVWLETGRGASVDASP